MTPQPLPTFKYHPNPLATGSIIPSSNTCICCHRPRGYIYTGPTYATKEYNECICPWCIADGTAHAELGVTFHDESAIPGCDFPDSPPVPDSVIAEVSQRTPGFTAWQQEQWFTCCNDAAAFLGRANRQQLESYPGATPYLQLSSDLDGDEWEEFLDSLDPDGSPTAYVFRCLHCGQHAAYWDCD